MRDCASDLELFLQAQGESVMTESLLRNVRKSIVERRFNSIIQGRAELSEYHFVYNFPDVADHPPQPKLEFKVVPNSEPPTNIHVLIGRNGVGKSTCMANLAAALMGKGDEEVERARGSISPMRREDDW